jgi:hypothetical protein
MNHDHFLDWAQKDSNPEGFREPPRLLIFFHLKKHNKKRAMK